MAGSKMSVEEAIELLHREVDVTESEIVVVTSYTLGISTLTWTPSPSPMRPTANSTTSIRVSRIWTFGG